MEIKQYLLNNWIPISSTVLSMIGVGYGARRLEKMMEHKKKDERSEIYNRLGALESEQSSQRSETKRVDNSYEELRQGCIVIEKKADDAIVLANRADKGVDMLMSKDRK